MSCLNFAKPIIMEFVGGSMAEHICAGLLHCCQSRPRKGKADMCFQIEDDRSGLKVRVTGTLKSKRARVRKTKYKIKITNKRRQSNATIHVVGDSVHLESNGERLSRGLKLRTIDDPSVLFTYLRLNTHSSFVVPQTVVPSGCLQGYMINAEMLLNLDGFSPSRPKGPSFFEAIQMKSSPYRNNSTL